MGFKADYNKAQDDYSKPEGIYECIITNVKRSETPNGKRKICLWLTIRNDVEQPAKNGLLFLDIWHKTDEKINEDDKAVDGFDFGKLMAIAKAVHLPQDKDYENLQQLLDDFIKKPIRAEMYIDTYNGKRYEKLKNLQSTQFPEVRHVFKNAPVTSNDQFAAPAAASVGDVSDDDYPF